jgi:hypothetical protein
MTPGAYIGFLFEHCDGALTFATGKSLEELWFALRVTISKYPFYNGAARY